MSRFSQLIEEVADQKNHALSDVLLKAKVLAHRFRSRTFRQWVNSEIDGYDVNAPLPDYRVLRANLRGEFVGPFQSRVRNVPLSTSILESDAREILEKEPMRSSVAYIEDLTNQDGECGRSLDINVVDYLRQHGEQIDDMILNHVQKLISKHALAALLTSVRSRLLEFLLELRDKYPELDKNEEAVERISQTEIDSVMEKRVYKDCTIFERSAMRDVYQAGQAGAMGPGARAENINFIQILRDAIGDHSLADLAADLERLRAVMLSESKSAEQDAAVAAVAKAEAAAKKGEAEGVCGYLKGAGKWALDVATKVGTAVAQKAIEKSMGL
jgi:hypothetical protein